MNTRGNLRVPWHEHLRRIFGKDHESAEAWHKHLYRALRSLAKDPRYSPAPRPIIHDFKSLRRIVQTTIRRHSSLHSCPPISSPGKPTLPRRLFLDVTFTARHNHRSGIQRVVRNIARQSRALCTDDLSVIPVEIKNGELHPCRKFDEGRPLLTPAPTESVIIRRGDVFVAMDTGWGMLDEYETLFPVLKANDVTVIGIVYDLIPLSHCEFFSDTTELPPNFAAWFGLLAAYSRTLVGISRATRDETRAYLRRLAFDQKLSVDYFHLGFDRAEIQAPAENPAGFFAAHKYNLLMVGTLEIRKGHGTALDAFDILRGHRSDVALHIIGNQGWNTADVVARIQRHPLKDKSLFWHVGASDMLVAQAYSECQLLIAASVIEGFGLPLIEAAQTNLAIVASDIRVFSEVAGEHAYYFPVGDSGALAKVLAAALADIENQTARSSQKIPVLNWHQSGAMLIRAARAHLHET